MTIRPGDYYSNYCRASSVCWTPAKRRQNLVDRARLLGLFSNRCLKILAETIDETVRIPLQPLIVQTTADRRY